MVWDQVAGALGDAGLIWPNPRAFFSARDFQTSDFQTQLRECRARHWVAPPDIGTSSTHGKKPEEAKALELKGWAYPRHLAGRHFGVVTHGDSIGAETMRRSLVDWLTDMSLISAGGMAETDGYIGYQEPYATSHQALDEDDGIQQDVCSAATTLARGESCSAAAQQQIHGRLPEPGDLRGRRPLPDERIK